MPGAFNFVDPRLAAVMAPMRLSRPSSRLGVVGQAMARFARRCFFDTRIYQGGCRREHHAAIKMIVLVVGDHPNGLSPCQISMRCLA